MSDVVVVGAGIIGLSVAWRLTQRGVRVRVLDSAAPAAAAAAAGMLAPSFETDHLNPEAAAFGYRSLALWRDFAAELERESGIDVDLRRGVLGVARIEYEHNALSTAAAAARAAGFAAQTLTGAEARAAEPGLSADVDAALLSPDEGEVEPRRVLAALAAALGGRGVMVERREIRRIDEAGRGLRLFGARDAIVDADIVVLAAGGLVGRIAGLGARAAARVFPLKGEALALAAPAAPVRHVVRAHDVYLCPKTDGRLVIGATSIPFIDSLDVDAARIDRLRRRADALVPALAPLSEQERWAGLRPAIVDGAPLIGPDPEGPPRLLYAIGHYRNGVLLAPATAEAIAGHVEGRRVAAFEALGPGRFRHA